MAMFLEAKKEGDDPLKGMQQAKAYADCERYEVNYVFATNGHRYGENDCFTEPFRPDHSRLPNFPPHPDLTARYARTAASTSAHPDRSAGDHTWPPAKRKASIDNLVFTKEEILQTSVQHSKTGLPLGLRSED